MVSGLVVSNGSKPSQTVGRIPTGQQVPALDGGADLVKGEYSSPNLWVEAGLNMDFFP